MASYAQCHTTLSKTSSSIVAWQAMSILFFDQDVENPPCRKCSINYVDLYPYSVLKLFDQVFFLHPSQW
jgi:hypothetical protein